MFKKVSFPTCPKPLQTCSSMLLSLPGEIRNIIYGFCVEIDPFPSIPLNETHSEQLRAVYRSAAYLQLNQSLPQDFLGLSHGCTQLRQEFRPIYMKESKIFLHLDRLPKFLAAFFPSLTAETLPEACGNFVVIIPEHMEHNVDVTRLLQFRTHAPNVTFSFVTLSPQFMWSHGYMHIRREILTRVLFPNPDCSTKISGAMLWLAPSISRLEIRFQHGLATQNGRADVEFWSSHLDIWFTRGVKEKWMEGEARQCGTRHERSQAMAKEREEDLLRVLDGIFKVSRDISRHVTPFVEARAGWIDRMRERFRHWLK